MKNESRQFIRFLYFFSENWKVGQLETKQFTAMVYREKVVIFCDEKKLKLSSNADRLQKSLQVCLFVSKKKSSQ